MNFKNILFNNKKLYLFTILALGCIMVNISSCDEDIPGVGEIDDLTPPSAVFAYTAGADGDYNIITFKNTSISSTDYAWDFGDGGSSTEREPVYTYAVDGTYTATLTASDKSGTSSIATQSISIEAPPIPLSADFSFAVSTVEADFSMVTFTDLSVSADTYAWDFGDGVGTSTDPSPQYTYAMESGSYEVTLIASSSVTSESETVTRTVNIIDPFASLAADFSFVAGNPNTYEITFTNLSTGASSYLWDFGDGSTSTDEAPVYTYAAPGGTFTVTLTASDAGGGSQVSTQTITVTVPAHTFTPVILEPGFEDLSLPDGTGDGRDSWRDPGEELGGVIQITSGPVVGGSQAAKLKNDNSRVGYQMITVEAYQNYILSFNYTMKTDPVGALRVAVLSGEVNDPALVDAAVIADKMLTDQTDANAYVYETIQFNSGPSTEIVIYFHTMDGIECRLDDFDIQNN